MSTVASGWEATERLTASIVPAPPDRWANRASDGAKPADEPNDEAPTVPDSPVLLPRVP